MGRPLAGQRMSDSSADITRPRGDAPPISLEDLEAILADDGWSDAESLVVIPQWEPR